MASQMNNNSNFAQLSTNWYLLPKPPSMILRVFIANNITVQLTDDQQHRVLIDLSGL